MGSMFSRSHILCKQTGFCCINCISRYNIITLCDFRLCISNSFGRKWFIRWYNILIWNYYFWKDIGILSFWDSERMGHRWFYISVVIFFCPAWVSVQYSVAIIRRRKPLHRRLTRFFSDLNKYIFKQIYSFLKRFIINIIIDLPKSRYGNEM